MSRLTLGQVSMLAIIENSAWPASAAASITGRYPAVIMLRTSGRTTARPTPATTATTAGARLSGPLAASTATPTTTSTLPPTAAGTGSSRVLPAPARPASNGYPGPPRAQSRPRTR
ncbi:hypothetical protein [Nonomuraea sp. CA-141351]|uniref:hypothetical protein n=1 Tax=Nonomuraea sp. CA-141351 TaxID=3239996 RepID=UPI003D9064A6